MIEQLKEICTKRKFVSIYTNSADSDRFCYGKVLSVNEEEILLYLISPDGEYDGLSVKNTNSIFRVEYGGEYERKMLSLMTEENLDYFEQYIDDNDLFLSVLILSQKCNKIVSVEVENSGNFCITGIVEDVNEDVCKIKQFDDYGNFDGYSIVKIDSISELSLDSIDERRISKLIKECS